MDRLKNIKKNMYLNDEFDNPIWRADEKGDFKPYCRKCGEVIDHEYHWHGADEERSYIPYGLAQEDRLEGRVCGCGVWECAGVDHPFNYKIRKKQDER
jgi:hypothetical protein